MFSPSPAPRGASDAEFIPMLFPLTAVEGLPQTPRSGPARAESSVSTQRRSVTPPGSVHTSDTHGHAQPPPISRLADDTTMDDVNTSAADGGRTAGTPPRPFHLSSPLGGGGGGGAAPSTTLTVSTSYDAVPQPQHEDVWVTVYGFGANDIATVLAELSKCGDILRWVFGSPPTANYMHVQFQNKWCAQRALSHNGQLLARGLMIGVKVPEHAHRQALAADGGDAAGSETSGTAGGTGTSAAGGGSGGSGCGGGGGHLDGFGAGMQALRPKQQPERMYLVDPAVGGRQGVQMPQPARSSFTRALEFVLGY